MKVVHPGPGWEIGVAKLQLLPEVPDERAQECAPDAIRATAHEVLGIASGSGRLMLGGPHGREFDVSAGDVIVIPAGVVHRRLAAAHGFLVIGGYPPGPAWDLLRGDPDDRAFARAAIAAVPVPKTDPVTGSGGALVQHWR